MDPFREQPTKRSGFSDVLMFVVIIIEIETHVLIGI